ncbi:UDP-4-amino-4-deoxy-L-arabinose formyltransferase, partial [Morganella morganii]|uniref:formyltransferase n=1 Tax=Morganella morganii TaxID=582 RepID=UPI0006C29FCB
MKAIVFAYHDIGCVGLKALKQAGFDVQAVFTHTDDPGENHFFSSVARVSADMELPVYAPENVNHPLWVDRIRELKPDVIFSFYYRDMLSEDILALAPKGAFNLHGSLLPKYRGRAPINWAVLNGETETGVTLHKMVAKADAGDIVAQEKVTIGADDTSLIVHGKVREAAEILLNKTLPLIEAGTYKTTAQDESQATYFGRRCAEDGLIDWNQPAAQIHNLVRAVTEPYPGAFTFLGERKMIIWRSRVLADNKGKRPGTVISAEPLVIACGNGALEVISGQGESGLYVQGPRLAAEMGIVPDVRVGPKATAQVARRKRVLILGVNGFIGNHLT